MTEQQNDHITSALLTEVIIHINTEELELTSCNTDEYMYQQAKRVLSTEA